MGDLVLKGSTSGQITVTPTAVAGTNTLTLPAKTGNIITSADSGTVTGTMIASGTVAVSNLTTGAPSWTSGGNVGIGISSPTYMFQIRSSSGPYFVLDGTGGTTAKIWAVQNRTDVSGEFWIRNDTDGVNAIKVTATGNVTIAGSISKGSGTFTIDHPLPSLNSTHNLVHSFIEGPQADLIYRGVAQLIDGKATVNIDEAADMTEGTFVLLCRDVQCFTCNETDWDAVRGKVTGNILTIESQNVASTASVSWLVIGERQDKHIKETNWTDDNGKVIVEPLKEFN